MASESMLRDCPSPEIVASTERFARFDLYYYTDTRPMEESTREHSTVYVESPFPAHHGFFANHKKTGVT